jgi:transcriptional regulator
MAHAPEPPLRFRGSGPVDRFKLKRKLSQNKDDETRRNVIAALREAGPYRHPELAKEMERELA